MSAEGCLHGCTLIGGISKMNEWVTDSTEATATYNTGVSYVPKSYPPNRPPRRQNKKGSSASTIIQHATQFVPISSHQRMRTRLTTVRKLLRIMLKYSLAREGDIDDFSF